MMIRRALLWLMRREIAEAVSLLLEFEAARAKALHELEKRTEYLRGLRDGTEDAFRSVERAVRERMCGGDDAVQFVDVHRARKGYVN